MMFNEERRELTFSELVSGALALEEVVCSARKKALRNFADGLGIDPAGAYCSYVSTCAELDLNAKLGRENLDKALKAASDKLLAGSAVSS